MGLKFLKKVAAGSSAPPSTQAHSVQETPQQPSNFKPSPKSTVSYLKTGKEAKEIAAQEAAKLAKAKESYGLLWRFMMEPNKDRVITFLDGELDDDGILEMGARYWEHTIKVNGRWENYVCPLDEEGQCPLCNQGDRRTYVGVLTIIDHTPATIQKGVNAGNVIVNQRKKFVCKATTIGILGKKAGKHGGLTGCTFEVSRGDEKTPNVGSQFDFVKKYNSYEEIAEAYDLKLEDAVPADYTKEVIFHSVDDLLELGLGKPSSGPGYTKAGKIDKGKLSKEL